MTASALAFADAGIPIIPVRLQRKGDGWGKEPYVRNWRQRATIDAATIEGWWRQWPDAVPGIVLEHAGLVVVDADRHPGKPDGVAALSAFGPLPPHPIVPTQGGGEHHYFRQPDPPVSFIKWAGGEVLGTTRFAVGYSLPRGPLPVLPEWLRKALSRRHAETVNNHTHMLPIERGQGLERGPPTPPTICAPTQSVQLRSRYLLREVERAQRGNRNNCLHWAACRFGNMIAEGKIAPEVAERLLILAAKGARLWREDGADACQRTIRSGLIAGVEEWRLAAVGPINREHVESEKREGP